jgi:formiminoglutamate deiminase
MSGETQVFHCDYAWLGGERAAADVRVEVTDGVISAVAAGAAADADAVRLAGLTMPGLANTHSHVFHRAIRGHSQSGVADFWLWRDLMYGVASRLDPDSLYRLAYATYVEMVLSGITSVGEFFYVHHDVGGKRYADPNEMGRAVIRAANDAGIRITLLDTIYLQAGVDGEPVGGTQQRFSDGSWQNWVQRVDLLKDSPMARVGGAIHSVRAVPRSAMGPVAEYCRGRGMPLHVHVSEQPAENAASVAAFGLTPVGVLAAESVLGPSATAVHATHLTDGDIGLLGSSGTAIAMCCTTERDLGDGVGPAARLASAGSPLCVGSDAHMMIDLWEEGRAMELDLRLISGKRGHLTARQIAAAISTDGQAAVGWAGAAAGIAAGAPADLVTVDLDSVRIAGARSGDVLASTLFTATASDVDSVMVGGRFVVRDGRHHAVSEPGRALAAASAAVLD